MLERGQLDLIVPALTRFRAKRVPLQKLLIDAHALGTRFSARDALYVALTRRIEAEFFTRDRPLAEACADLIPVTLF